MDSARITSAFIQHPSKEAKKILPLINAVFDSSGDCWRVEVTNPLLIRELLEALYEIEHYGATVWFSGRIHPSMAQELDNGNAIDSSGSAPF